MERNNINVNKWDYNKYKNQEYKFDYSKIKYQPRIRENFLDDTQIEIAGLKHEKWIREKLIPLNFKSPYTAEQYIKQETFKMFSKIVYLSKNINESSVLMFSRICDLGFVIDDILLENQLVGMEYIETLFNKDESDKHDHFGMVIWETINDMYEIGIKESVDHFIENFKNWTIFAINLKTNLIEYFNKCDNKLSNVTIEDYLQLRSYDAGAEFSSQSSLIKLCISNEIRNSNEYKEMYLLCK